MDIIEVGSPFIIEEGMRPVRIFKEKYPDCEILADTKIMDAGEYEAEETFKAGADYCTVLGVTDTLTIEGCVKAAKEYGKQTMVDMICVEVIIVGGGINHAEDPVAAAKAIYEAINQ